MRLLRLTAVGVLLVGAAACGGDGPGNTITGFQTIVDLGADMGSWDDCEGTGGFSDITPNSFVEITNQDGKIIGATTLRNMTEDDLSALALFEAEVEGWSEEIL